MEVQNPTTQVNIYLTFNGNCEEAINYYQSILGGEIKMKSTFGEGPMEVPDSHKDKIMHIEYVFDGCQLLASDGMGEAPCVMGTNFHVSVFLADKEKAKLTFVKLGEGGKTQMEFNKVFWGGSFGTLVDKFGIQWMLSCP
jgi:PhnB protein